MTKDIIKTEDLWEGKETLSCLDILDLDIPKQPLFLDRELRSRFFSDHELRLMACDFAESVLYLYDGDSNAPAEAIRIARLFAKGKATREERVAADAAEQEKQVETVRNYLKEGK